jgi:hypothetical protein
MSRSEQYPIYEQWYGCMSWLLDRCESMPRHHRHTLTSRIVNLCSDILEGIIEIIYSKDKRPKIIQVNLHLEKLRFYLRICHDKKYLSHAQYFYGANEVNKTGTMLGGWLKVLGT